MAIYRSDQATFSFHSEAGQGGMMDYISAVDDAGDWTALINVTAGIPPGTRAIVVDTGSGTLEVNNYITLGSTASGNQEIRKIVSIGTYTGGAGTGAGTIYIDIPTGFFHVNNEIVDEKVSTRDATTNLLTNLTGSSFATFIPGVWESINIPEMRPEITPHYFMGVSSDRNFTVAYRGKQAFSGNIPNFILLDGRALRFPFGRVRTVAGAISGGSSTISLVGGTLKGQRYLPIVDISTFANGEYIEIERGGTNPEVRQIISGGGTTTLILNYPLMLSHANGVTVAECTSGTTFTHTIVENFELDSTCWNIMLRDSDETRLNDIIRRYVGGKIGRAKISAEEGGLLMMSWDEVPFIDMVHNQLLHSSVGGGTTEIQKSSAALIDPTTAAIAAVSSSRGVGSDIPHSGGALGIATYPTTEPYYFSQGSITFFGVEFARIRNFGIDINNNLDPRYYIRDLSTDRTPFEVLEQRREYRMDATIALPDSTDSTSAARTLFKELITEGNYGSGMQGFAITLTFTRGTNDTITITIPNGGTASTGIDANGAFILNAPHNINPNENPIQVPVEILFRNIGIVIVDSLGVYP